MRGDLLRSSEVSERLPTLDYERNLLGSGRRRRSIVEVFFAVNSRNRRAVRRHTGIKSGCLQHEGTGDRRHPGCRILGYALLSRVWRYMFLYCSYTAIRRTPEVSRRAVACGYVERQRAHSDHHYKGRATIAA